MFLIRAPSIKRIVVFQLICYFLFSTIVFVFNNALGKDVLLAGVFFLLNLFLWISLINKLIFILTRNTNRQNDLSKEDPEEDRSSGGISLAAMFLFFLKMGLLSVICILAMEVVSGISIIFSNTIIVLSLLFSSIRVNLSTQKGESL
ncbi:MAG: hypothetical protein CMK59_11480 [Proteobacteria bacterium]|nr:hypothetical protein [Pseudomonadota bacterium]